MRRFLTFLLILLSGISPLCCEENPSFIAPTFEKRWKEAVHPKAEGTNLVGRIVIDDKQSGINQGTWIYVKKALDYYREKKPLFIILELNTPGGEVFSAQQISDALKEFDTQESIPVVTYINNWAISAGVMLTYSTRFITTVKDGTMGAAEPVIQGESGEMKTASEKVNSALRADFASRARFFDRNPAIAEAMVDKDLILVMRKGQIIKLDSESSLVTTGPDPDIVISPKGKLLTLNAEEMMRYGVADMLMLPEKLTPMTKEEKSLGSFPGDKMLLFKQPQFRDIPRVYIDTYQMDWKTRLFVFLNHPIVSSILVMGLLFGAYIEFTTPGATLPGTVSFLCLFLIVLSSFALEIGNFLELILVLTGIGVIIVDVFFLPTFGFLGILGALSFFIGLAGLLLPGLHDFSFEWESKTVNAAGALVIERLGWLALGVVGAAVLALFFSRKINPERFKRLVLMGHEQDDYRAWSHLAYPAKGSLGVTLTTLRPAGKVEVAGKQYDALSRGAFIEKGNRVTVIGFDSGALIVVEQKEL